jgi:hypothetical protein
MEWIIAFSIALPLFFLGISIPSLILIYKIGISSYIDQLKYMYALSDKIDGCYVYSQNINQNFTYTDGSKTNINYKISTYFFPIYINHNNVYVIDKKDNSSLPYLEDIGIIKYTRDKSDWKSYKIKIKYSTCIWNMILKYYFNNKIKLKLNNHTKIDNIEDLYTIINSNIKKITRDHKLKNIGI